MAVKKIYTIKDEILNDEYKVFGQSGVLQTENKNIMLLDFGQMAQYIIENCAEAKDDECLEFTISEEKLTAICNQWSREISNMILDSIYENAISDIKDDETLKLR